MRALHEHRGLPCSRRPEQGAVEHQPRPGRRLDHRPREHRRRRSAVTAARRARRSPGSADERSPSSIGRARELLEQGLRRRGDARAAPRSASSSITPGASGAISELAGLRRPGRGGRPARTALRRCRAARRRAPRTPALRPGARGSSAPQVAPSATNALRSSGPIPAGREQVAKPGAALGPGRLWPRASSPPCAARAPASANLFTSSTAYSLSARTGKWSGRPCSRCCVIRSEPGVERVPAGAVEGQASA